MNYIKWNWLHVFNIINFFFRIDASEPKNDGKDILTIQATDADIDENAKITYSIEGGDGKFEITSTGTIKLTDSLDRETKVKHTITVFALNGDQSASTQVIINVIDINDNRPIFNNKFLSITIEENVNCGPSMPLMQVNSTDHDAGKNGQVTYNVKE